MSDFLGSIGGIGSGLGTFLGLNPVQGDASGVENNRQKKINQGMTDINAVFSGGTLPNFNLATGPYNKKTQYFTPNAQGSYSPWNISPSQGGGHSRAGAAIGAEYGSFLPVIGTGLGALAGSLLGGLFGRKKHSPNYAAEYAGALNQGKLYTQGSPTTYQGFGPNFFNQYIQDYLNNYVPQLASQYNQAQQQIGYGLANRGLTGGSAARQAQSNLDLSAGQQQQQLVGQAESGAQSLQQNVEQARQQAINQLYTAADPAQALQQSISSATDFRTPNTFGQLTNLFGGLVGGYGSGLPTQLAAGTGTPLDGYGALPLRPY